MVSSNFHQAGFCLVVFTISVTIHLSLNLDGHSVPTNTASSRSIKEEGDQRREERFEPVDEIIEETIEDESANDSFSACILWMDDNHRLEEWLAYHYYLLKLRYVVINIDYNSRTSPQSIIDRWNDRANKYNLNMTIVTFRDHEFMANYDLEMKNIEIAQNLTTDRAFHYGRAATAYHRSRQPQFYRACSQHLVQQNKSWTSYHDTDEFLTFNHVDEWNNDTTANGVGKMEQPGYVLRRLNSMRERGNETDQISCLIVNRRRFCTKELSAKETNDFFIDGNTDNDGTTGFGRGTVVPEGFLKSTSATTDEGRKKIVNRFDTLRYKYLTGGVDGMPKSFIDLSQTNPKLYAQDRWHVDPKIKHNWSTHRVMTQLCKWEERNRTSDTWTMVKRENFLIGHYLGSFESYSFRNDARQGGLRTYDIWKERANLTKGEFSLIPRPWLRGFVELVGGPSVASYLLQDAGKFPEDYDVVSRIHDYNQSYDYNRDKKKRIRDRKERNSS